MERGDIIVIQKCGEKNTFCSQPAAVWDVMMTVPLGFFHHRSAFNCNYYGRYPNHHNNISKLSKNTRVVQSRPERPNYFVVVGEIMPKRIICTLLLRYASGGFRMPLFVLLMEMGVVAFSES